MVIRTGILLLMFSMIFISCSDSKKDGGFEMSSIIGKDWCNNRWINDSYKLSYNSDDLLEVIRFESGGIVRGVEFSGRTDTILGNWQNDDSEITIHYKNGKTENWYVVSNNSTTLEVRINGANKTYISNPSYSDLTADAYLVTEISGTTTSTYLQGEVRGNSNIMETYMIIANNESEKLDYKNKSWTGKLDFEHDLVGKSGKDVRFYVNISNREYLKLNDKVYADNLEVLSYSNYGLEISNKGNSLTVEWEPYTHEDDDIYYQVEIWDENSSNIYFRSNIQDSKRTYLDIDANTKSDQDITNRIGELKSGNKYTLKYSVILFEPGIDAINKTYGYANKQAVIIVNKGFTLE